MALVSLPPELRALCRKLTATKPEQLPPLLPVLLKDVLRCQEPLSKPHEAKGGDYSSEASALVNKLKTQISTLITSRTPQGRFSGVILAKAVIEAGGWECLRTSDAWVRGLLSILQKKDGAVTKDLCIITLTKIYLQMHSYQTLIREIVSPTLPTFATACLQMLKPPASSKAPRIPHSLVETIFEALYMLVPLYPTTLRQFASKLKGELRSYLAPTGTDVALIPESLRGSSRRLFIRLSVTAPKDGEAAEWAKALEIFIRDFHTTADHVFRAVKETWESSAGYVPKQVEPDDEPRGGSDKAEDLPVWVGLQAGSERLEGLLDSVATSLCCGTKSAVVIPVTAIVDIVSRVSAIIPPNFRKEKTGPMQMNPAIGREEKDELWASLPDIQMASLRLLISLIRRLDRGSLTIAPEMLEQTLRMFASGYHLPEFRTASFQLISEILCICGPTLRKVTVDSLGIVIQSCCRDLLGAGGHLKQPKQRSLAPQNGAKSRTAIQNADAFLSNKTEDESIVAHLSPEHESAAETLLTNLFSHLPQQHLPSSMRSRMLQAAILYRSRNAQLASVLHPFRDSSGRTPQVILPYLTRQFPRDEAVEILRFNYRPLATGPNKNVMGVEGDMALDEDVQPQTTSKGFTFGQPSDSSLSNVEVQPMDFEQSSVAVEKPPKIEASKESENPFLAQTQIRTARTVIDAEQEGDVANSLKRKSSAADVAVSKRVEVEVETTQPLQPALTAEPEVTTTQQPAIGHIPVEEEGDDDDSDDESIQLNMELDSDSEDEGSDE